LVWLFSPAWDAVQLTLEFGFICPFVVIDPTYKEATTVVAPGLMIDPFLPIPDTESLPLYPMDLKLACVCVCVCVCVCAHFFAYSAYFLHKILLQIILHFLHILKRRKKFGEKSGILGEKSGLGFRV
jgi:hypothetical protein